MVKAQINLALIFLVFQFFTFLFNSLKTLFIALTKLLSFPPHLAEYIPGAPPKASISNPECISPVDMDRFGSLPVPLANEISAKANDQLTSQLESAKTEAMKAAKDHMDVVIKQLTDGKRLSETLVSLSALHSKMLRDLVDGYDNDPRIIAMADRIDAEIASQSVDRWKDSDYARLTSLKAAETVSKGLDAMAQPVTPDQIDSTNQSLAGGLLADLLD